MKGGNYNYAVDLSNNNGPTAFDPKAYAAAGHKRIILKATQGVGFIDPCFHGWAEAAQKAGLWVSAYHFADASGSAAEQAAFFSEQTKHLLLHHRILDIEQGGNVPDPVAFAEGFTVSDILYSDAGYLEQYGSGLMAHHEAVWPAAFPNLTAGWWDGHLWGHQFTETARIAGIDGECDLSVLF